MIDELFIQEYKKLNKAQREAVDSVDGPMMVVAGPGTGKTQILALRIGNILKKTDIKADGILCLTFTNSGVKAMKERLRSYIGIESNKVNVSTFHSFGMSVIEDNFNVLGMNEIPKLMDEKDIVILSDFILQDHEWKYIKPRSDNGRYLNDLKSFISFLKRERMTPEDFEKLLKEEIHNLENDESSISTRGESKGKLKKEIERKIEGLEKTIEAVYFYQFYEEIKKEKNLLDYDDVLENLVKIVEESDDVASSVRENYQYILIDEHQDSSGIQNEFLKKVWGEVDMPNIFVVGDDRQLIYGFGGASLEYFENFKNEFGKAKLIILIENYRSTQDILNSAHNLLQSSISKDKLKSNTKKSHPLYLVEASYERDEIILCALEIKKKIKEGIVVNNIAILAPKNRHIRSIMTILKDMDIPVATGEKLNFFDSLIANSFLRVLYILAYPNDGVKLAESFFDPLVNIDPIEAHKFIKKNNMRNLSFLEIIENIKIDNNSLFKEENILNNWILKLKSWLVVSNELTIYSLIQKIGSEFLLDKTKDHEDLIEKVEVIRTILHLVLSQIEKNSKLTLRDFLIFIQRLEDYREHIPLSVFGKENGIRVFTLHGSKGLEFDFVWIAHMDEKSFSQGKRNIFSLPENIKDKIEKRDEEVLKRELYVALTRARTFCTISYATHSYTGGDRILANVVNNIHGDFIKQNEEETEKIILAHDPKAYVENKSIVKENIKLEELKKIVIKDYIDRRVSVSLLNNFFICPWKWYFRNLLQLPESKTESLEFGNIVHGSIDKILKLANTPKSNDIKDIIHKEILKSNFGDDKKQKELEKETFNIIYKWVEFRLQKISKNRENEKSISKKDERFPHLNIYGKIDLLEFIDKDSICVTDFKTGSVRKKGDIEKKDEEGRMSDYMRQLTMYSYLLEENSKYKRKVNESRLEFVQAKNEKEMFYSTYINKEQIDLLTRDIMDYDNLLKNGNWLDRPCNFKSYGKVNAECEYCKMSEIYK